MQSDQLHRHAERFSDNWLPSATGDVKFARAATKDQQMAHHLRTCIRAIALTLSATPIVFAGELPKNFILHKTLEPGVVVRFEDNQGQALSLADFRGKTVLLNVWATWCVPCIKEIPALDRLAAALNEPDFAVVPVSIDRKGVDVVRKAFAERAVHKLPIYIDRSGEALRAVRAVGLPISLLIDREGRELGRAVGPAEWDDVATVAFFRQILLQKLN